ncbi:YcjF family protein [Roseibium salinum]|uniref:YcjF family protein n=1 Tax=Roseibium salinum TaxID=1604349 RepID=A0ABT3R9L9_9HYPH|nr:YcjF family protein [Roseibium sp. DSM 29163]MCX2725804.1 YcjF family protein [Roseibium sp. DSM 29163]MDN3720382.1 YcjF family protein [Roseibium salinum]
MSKKLPRTSNRTLDDLREAAKSTLQSEQESLHPAGPPATDPSSDGAAGLEADAPAGSRERGGGDTRRAQDPSAARDKNARLELRSPPPDRHAFLKNSGKLIIERHAKLAAVAGLVPMPWVDLAAIAVVVERMLRRLARLYGQPLETHRSKRLAAALLTGMAAPGIASFTTTGLLRMMPGPHLAGMAITSVAAAVLVSIIGEVYLGQLTSEALEVSA